MKKKKVFSKILAIVLVLSLMLSAFPSISVFAQEASSKEKLTEKGELWQPESNSNALNFEGDLSIEELQSAKLSDEDTPEIVGQDNIEEKGHVNRLWEQEEDLNTIIFQNRDGKKTMYYFTEPVKYKDKYGKIRDKKNKISETADGDFTNAENDINSYFPKKLHKNKGVVLKYQDISIEVAPLINGNSGASRQTGHNKENQPTEYVEYPSVFDDSILVRYTPTFGGFKEDIILSENVGINEFSFKIKTNGLALIQEEGIYYLANPLTGEKAIQIGNIVVYDSKPLSTTNNTENEGYETAVTPIKPELSELTEEAANSLYFPEESPEPIYNHHYIVQTIEEDNEYIITMSVDEAYLNSENTVYPVTVDPSITLQTSFSQDATIYSNYQVNEGYASNMFVGSYTNRYGGTRGVARSLVKFPGLFDNSTFQSLSASRIYKVQYILRDTMCESGAVWIDCYRVTQNWSEGTVKYNSSIWNAYTGFLDDAYVYYNGGTGSMGTGTGHWYPFDITEAVKDWKNGLYGGTSNHYGIMLKAYNESNSAKTFGTNNNSSLAPNIIVEYDPAVTGISLSPTYKEVDVGWSGYISAAVYPASALNKTVYWESSDPNVASINPTSGLICAGLAGSTVITATTADGGFKATCTLNVSQVLTYPDTLITNQATKDSIIKMKNFKDETTLAYLKGTISADARDKAYEEFDYQINLARADYIVVGNNPTSNYAYAILGGNPNASEPTSFSRILYLNTSNPMTGLDIIVVQRTLELYGYYDHDADSKYGTWDEYTHNAALSWSPLLSVSNGDRIFDGASFNVLFQSSNISQRTYDAMRLLQQFNLQHKFVQGYCMDALMAGGSNAATEVRIYYNSAHTKYGRTDLLGSTTGGTYVWEVKHNTPTAISTGDLQVQGYVTASTTVSNQNVMTNKGFSTPLIPGPSIFPKVAVPWFGKYLIFNSYTSTNPYRNALIVYEESTSVPGGYVYAPQPVVVDVPDPVPSYSFSISGVYDSLTNFGNGVVEGLRIDPHTGEILVVVCVTGVMCVMALGMIAAIA